jgi:23S rRNA (guanine2445-N2)-methyltransferase / 23S rRNA (guanine2069-N7)-methyltransferase
VLIEVGRFTATDFGELFDQTKALDWGRYIPADGQFPVNGRSVKSQLSSVPACQKVVKKAIVESLRAAHHTQSLHETGAMYEIEVALLKNEVTLTLNTSGPGLHKRGYRPLTGAAPLRETLAAALVMLTFWRPSRPMIDPFCGTGTIAIEAAMWGRRIAPGLKREFAAERWPCIGQAAWREARQEAHDAIQPELEERIIATDIDEEALSQARYHAKQAGVENDIHFQQRAFEDLNSARHHGCLITNPPWGRRLEGDEDLELLYRSLPIVLTRLPTWSHYILTAYPNFEYLLGQKADRRRKLYHASIECTYYQFHGPRPGEAPTPRPAADKPKPEDARHRPAATQVFGGLADKADEQAEVFANRLKRMARHLRRWPTRRGITCYRLYDRDVPEIPLIVDRYEDHLHLSEYARPHDRTPAQHAQWLDLMCKTAAQVLEVSPDHVYLKKRGRQRGLSQYERVARQNDSMIVNEGGLRFIVNLSDYVDTGLFLDHRITRSMVRDDASGRHFVNLFGYTGAFSVYAAAGGAASTVTVDLSNTYLDRAKANMTLNGFDSRDHKFVRSDAMKFIETLPVGGPVDLAVVDPPTFSNSKMTEGDWDVQQHYATLLNALIQRMTPGGLIYFSTNFRRFKFDEAMIDRAESIREISKQTVPEDFRNKRIHRCWKIQVGTG